MCQMAAYPDIQHNILDIGSDATTQQPSLQKRRRPSVGALAEDKLGYPSTANAPLKKIRWSKDGGLEHKAPEDEETESDEYHASRTDEDDNDTNSATTISICNDTSAPQKGKFVRIIAQNLYQNIGVTNSMHITY